MNRGAVLRAFVAIIILFFTSMPFLLLLWGSVSAAAGGTLSISAFALQLFIRTIAIEAGSAGLSVLLGLLAAIGIWVFFEKRAGQLVLILFLIYIIPSFIHLQSWIFFMDWVNSLISALLPAAPDFTGNAAVILTTAISGLPITAGMVLVALISVPSEMVDLCRLDLHGARAFLRVYLPYLIPPLVIGGFLVFFLNINDFAIPSLFGVNVYSLEIFSRFSAGMDIYEVFVVSVPLLLLCVILAALFALYISKNGFSLGAVKGNNPFKNEKFLKIPAILGLIILAFFVFVPFTSLFWEAISAGNLIATLRSSMNELLYSIEISALTAVICLVPSLLFAYLFYRSKKRVLLLAIASLPFVIAAPISGLALIKMWNTQVLGIIYRSPIMPSLGLLSRFAFIGMLIISSAMIRLDTVYIDGLRLHYPGPIKSALCIFNLIKKECISTVLIIFALSMGEFGMTLLITPPGYQTLTNKIYNYLHYGASGTIAVLCLFMLILVLTAVLLAYYVMTGRKNEKTDN